MKAEILQGQPHKKFTSVQQKMEKANQSQDYTDETTESLSRMCTAHPNITADQV